MRVKLFGILMHDCKLNISLARGWKNQDFADCPLFLGIRLYIFLKIAEKFVR